MLRHRQVAPPHHLDLEYGGVGAFSTGTGLRLAEEALTRRPHYPEALNTKALALKRLGRREEALAALTLAATSLAERLRKGTARVLSQDRLTEKQLFDRLGIPLPAYRSVDSAADLEAAAREIGLPLVVKTRRLGYDGKGQYVLRDLTQIDAAVEELGGSDLIAEQWVAFDCEVSAIGVRNPAGDMATYCLTQNEHGEGILRISRAPVKNDPLTDRANGYMQRLLDDLDYVGVLALELFVVGEDLLANEFAPRVHNSGHWTIEGAVCSQFENHVRAILDLPLGETRAVGHAGMVNFLGELPALEDVLAEMLGRGITVGKAT